MTTNLSQSCRSQVIRSFFKSTKNHTYIPQFAKNFLLCPDSAKYQLISLQNHTIIRFTNTPVQSRPRKIIDYLQIAMSRKKKYKQLFWDKEPFTHKHFCTQLFAIRHLARDYRNATATMQFLHDSNPDLFLRLRNDHPVALGIPLPHSLLAPHKKFCDRFGNNCRYWKPCGKQHGLVTLKKYPVRQTRPMIQRKSKPCWHLRVEVLVEMSHRTLISIAAEQGPKIAASEGKTTSIGVSCCPSTLPGHQQYSKASNHGGIPAIDLQRVRVLRPITERKLFGASHPTLWQSCSALAVVSKNRFTILNGYEPFNVQNIHNKKIWALRGLKKFGRSAKKKMNSVHLTPKARRDMTAAIAWLLSK